jgi:membrane associated rhomboid family serine protease
MATPIATLLIVIVTGVVSFLAFNNSALKGKLIFSPQSVLADKEYYRVVTPAFLHADWQHLFFNMISLYLFAENMEPAIGSGRFVLIYFAGIIGGSLLSLYLHRHHEYFSLGASGGVCGIIFSSVFLFPGSRIYIFSCRWGFPAGFMPSFSWFRSFMGGGRNKRTSDTTPIWAGQ